MALVFVNDYTLQAIANALRYKANTSRTYKPADMAMAILDLQTSDAISFYSFISRELTGDIRVDSPTIGKYALAYNPHMTSLTLDANTIEGFGCCNCEDLKTVRLTADDVAIGQNAFYRCFDLESLTANNISTIGDDAFGYCTALTTLEATSVGYVGEDAFANCGSLTKLDFTRLDEISDAAFRGALALDTVIIRNTSKPPACGDTTRDPFPAKFYASYTGADKGYIYVPAAMLDKYVNYVEDKYGRYGPVSYDKWSMLNYRTIEDYPFICG